MYLARCHLMASKSKVAVAKPSLFSGSGSIMSPPVFFPSCTDCSHEQQRSLHTESCSKSGRRTNDEQGMPQVGLSTCCLISPVGPAMKEPP